MKPSLLLLPTLLCFSSLSAQDRLAPGPDGANVSLKLEVERAIAKGVEFLKTQQDKEKGSWSDPVNPAFSALAISSILGDPNLDPAKGLPAEVEKGYDFLLSNVKDDG
ncbi:MAG: hypothetical protein KDN18_17885, partial [Verrucomicrobiae bacterium]|nr:hypothetical protein [Verrucomicrobiae bacterium]